MPAYSSNRIVLDSMPGTLVQLGKKTGFARSTVKRAVGRLYADHKCHIVDWVLSAVGEKGPLLAVYIRGEGKDVVCPAVSRRLKDGVCMEAGTRARMKAIADAERVSKVRDPMLWCMFDVNVSFDPQQK